MFTLGGEERPRDWLSLSGNSYFYMVNVGVVFPKLSSIMRDCLATSPGIEPLDGIPPSLIPFVFSPLVHYTKPPNRLQNPSTDSPLRYIDAEELIQCLCKLPEALKPLHSLEQAVSDAEDTLEAGSGKAFLLVLAYLELGRAADAASFAHDTISKFRSSATREFYQEFLRNVEVRRGVCLLPSM